MDPTRDLKWNICHITNLIVYENLSKTFEFFGNYGHFEDPNFAKGLYFKKTPFLSFTMIFVYIRVIYMTYVPLQVSCSVP